MNDDVKIARIVCVTIVLVATIIASSCVGHDWLAVHEYVAHGFCPQAFKRELPSSVPTGYWYWETIWVKCQAEKQ